MLYISRCVYKTSYGVCDTDDGVEEIMDVDSLGSHLWNLDIDIAGTVFSSLPEMDRFVEGFEVYQPPETLSPLQIKTKMLCGVDVLTWRGVVTNIRYTHERVAKPIRLRLSDFGRGCADCILHSAKNIGFHKLTLVLDDRLRLTEHTFDFMCEDDVHEGIGGIGVAIDLSEVKNFKLAELAYRSFIHDAWHNLSDSIIDSVGRKEMIMSRIR